MSTDAPQEQTATSTVAEKQPTAVASHPPGAASVWGSYIAVLAAAGGAVALFFETDPNLVLDVNGWEVLAPVFFAAQALERLLEPAMAFLKPTGDLKDDVRATRENKLLTERAVVRSMVAGRSAGNGGSGVIETTELTSAKNRETNALRALRKKRSEKAVLAWAIASVLGLLFSGAIGLGILDAMHSGDDALNDGVRALDIVLTGLVIGAGTKPLHDLVARLEKSKTNADSATKPTDKLPGTPPSPAVNPTP